MQAPYQLARGGMKLGREVCTHAAPSNAPTVPHVPVLLDEILGFFADMPVRVYVDGTLGAGGHAEAVARHHPELHTLVAFDLDPAAHALAGNRLARQGLRIASVTLDGPGNSLSVHGNEEIEEEAIHRVGTTAFLVRANFSALGPVLRQIHANNGIRSTEEEDGAVGIAGHVNAALLDLGISSMQVDNGERGFSFLRDGPLDMRMDPGAILSAEEIVNTWPEAKLGQIIRDFGEERYWKGIARRLAAAREIKPLRTTAELVSAIGNPGGKAAFASAKKKAQGGGGYTQKHPATRVFQALRIAVNSELQSIATALPVVIDSLAPGGRLAVITFHSLEDRIVKWAFRQAAGMAPTDEPLPDYCVPFQTAAEPKVRVLTRRPVTPSEDEQLENPRSRSAKLRVVERL